jgi:glycerate-2-kinase
MSDLSKLRRAAREIFESALLAVDARVAVERATNTDGLRLKIMESEFMTGSQPIYVVALGKAAFAMTLGLNQMLGDKIQAGVITCPVETVTCALPPSKWQIFVGGHPLPNESSLDAAKAAFALLDRASSERAFIVFLISGGGSAMMEWPRNVGITLTDLREANRALVQSGASISEINAVRRAFSSVKGGGLARRAGAAQHVTLIVSDTAEGDEASVASGPTLLAPANSPDPVAVVEQYRLEQELPKSILRTISQSRNEVGRVDIGRHYVLLNNSTAIQAAAARAASLGFATKVRNDIADQSIEEGCELLLAGLNSSGAPEEICLISGGEFSCRVRGNGRGGRNLETVLRCAMQLHQTKAHGQHTVILSVGTDGIDGSSPAAGGIADELTIERATSAGMKAQTFLDNSDSHGFLAGLNDEIITGPTGTNVRDVRVLLRTGKV